MVCARCDPAPSSRRAIGRASRPTTSARCRAPFATHALPHLDTLAYSDLTLMPRSCPACPSELITSAARRWRTDDADPPLTCQGCPCARRCSYRSRAVRGLRAGRSPHVLNDGVDPVRCGSVPYRFPPMQNPAQRNVRRGTAFLSSAHPPPYHMGQYPPCRERLLPVVLGRRTRQLVTLL